LGAHVLFPGECERGLRLRHLLFRLLVSRLLRIDLGVEVGDGGLRLVDLRLRLINGDPVIAVIDAGQHGAGVDELIVGHRDVDDGAIDLRADRCHARINEGVVSRLVLTSVEPPH
jgi:hypothetical protein